MRAGLTHLAFFASAALESLTGGR